MGREGGKGEEGYGDYHYYENTRRIGLMSSEFSWPIKSRPTRLFP